MDSMMLWLQKKKKILIRYYRVEEDRDNSAPFGVASYDVEDGKGQRKHQICTHDGIGNHEKPVLKRSRSLLVYICSRKDIHEHRKLDVQEHIRECWKIIVLGPELKELSEEGKPFPSGSHGYCTYQGTKKCNDPENEVQYGYPFVPPSNFWGA